MFLLLQASFGRLPTTRTRDWLDYVDALSGVAGAALAGLAIAYAAWQSTRTKQELIHERRLEFELRLLADMRYQISRTQFQHIAGYVGALIVDTEDEKDLPVLRASIEVKSGPVGNLRVAEIRAQANKAGTDPFAAVLTESILEIDSAIERRLTS